MRDSCAAAVRADVMSASAKPRFLTTPVNAGLVSRTNRRAGIVRPKNGAEVVARARAADCTPLAHSNTMSVTHSAHCESSESAVRRRRGLDGKVGTVEEFATRSAHHEA